MPSCSASSFSQGDAFISSKPLRTTTFTSSPPRRRAVRQQSIAVLPPPSTSTRRPIRSTWPNATLASQSMPMWMPDAASARPGRPRSRPRGAPLPTKTASYPSSSSAPRLSIVRPSRSSGMRPRTYPTSSSSTLSGSRNLRDLRAHHPARPWVLVVEHHVVAERQQVARDRERGRAGADEGDSFAVLGRRRLRQPCPDVPLVVGSDALQAADRDRLGLDAAASARRLAGAVAGPAEHPWEDVGVPVHHIGVGVAAGGDQPDVLGHGRVCRARPLTVDHLVEVSRVSRVGRRHAGVDGAAPRRTLLGAEVLHHSPPLPHHPGSHRLPDHPVYRPGQSSMHLTKRRSGSRSTTSSRCVAGAPSDPEAVGVPQRHQPTHAAAEQDEHELSEVPAKGFQHPSGPSCGCSASAAASTRTMASLSQGDAAVLNRREAPPVNLAVASSRARRAVSARTSAGPLWVLPRQASACGSTGSSCQTFIDISGPERSS